MKTNGEEIQRLERSCATMRGAMKATANVPVSVVDQYEDAYNQLWRLKGEAAERKADK